MAYLGGSKKARPAQFAALAIWKNGTGFQSLTMRWRKVLSPLGLPARAVICTRANRRLVRESTFSPKVAVLRFPEPFRLVSFFPLQHLLPFSLSIWLRLDSSLWYLHSVWHLLPLFVFKSQLSDSKLNKRNLVFLPKWLFFLFFLHSEMQFWTSCELILHFHSQSALRAVHP